jgi:hypothetical protein
MQFPFGQETAVEKLIDRQRGPSIVRSRLEPRSPLPGSFTSGRLRLRCPFDRLTVSNPLNTYDPEGAPGFMLPGVVPE